MLRCYICICGSSVSIMVKRENVACSRESRNVTAQFFPRKYLHPSHNILFPFFLQNTKGFGCSFFGCIKVNYRWVMPRFEEISCGATGIIKIAQSCVCFGHESTISCKFHHFASLIFKSRVASKRRTISEKRIYFRWGRGEGGFLFFFFSI